MGLTDAVQMGLYELVERIMKAYQTEIRNQIEDSGLVDTGRFRDSVEYRIIKTPTGLKGQILALEYGLKWETGFNRQQVQGYIRSQINLVNDLEDYFSRKLADNPRRAAQLTVKAWRREGAPTRASRRFSRAPKGERTRFIGRAVETTLQPIEKFVADEGENVLLFAIRQPLRDLSTIR